MNSMTNKNNNIKCREHIITGIIVVEGIYTKYDEKLSQSLKI